MIPLQSMNSGVEIKDMGLSYVGEHPHVYYFWDLNYSKLMISYKTGCLKVRAEEATAN